MNGSAAGGGFEYQANVIAWVAVHILDRRSLKWLRLDSPPTPTAVSAETETAGDDLLVELVETEIELDSQVKKGLSADAAFRETIDRFAEGLSEFENRHFVLVVDNTTSRTIRNNLKQDLDRMRNGRYDGLTDVGEEVLERVEEEADANDVGRIHVVELQLLTDTAPHRQRAVSRLGDLVADATKAESAWSCLVEAGYELIRKRSRLTRESLRNLLSSRDIPLAQSEQTETFRQALEEAQAETFEAIYRAHLDTTSPDWDARFDRVRDLLEGQQVEVASELLETITDEADFDRLGPNELAAYYNLRGVTLLRLDRFKEAEEAFRRALEEDPECYPALVNMAAIELEIEANEEPRQWLERALEVRPEGSDAWALRLRLAEVDGEEIEIPDSVDESPELLVARVRSALDREDWDRLGELFRNTNVEEVSESLGPYQLLVVAEGLHAGTVNAATRSPEDALATAAEVCDAVADMLPDEGAVSLRGRAAQVRGKVHLWMGHYDEAVDDLQSAIVLTSGDWRPVYLLALAHMDRGAPERALEVIRDHDGAAPALLRGLEAEACVSVDEDDEARTIVRELHDEVGADEDYELRIMVAETALRAQLFNVAESVLEDLPDERMEGWDVRLLQGKLALTQGELNEAVAFYEEAAELAPSTMDETIRFQLAGHLQGEGELDGAIEQYEAANVIESNDKQAIRGYAVAVFNRGRLARASVILNEIEERQGREPWLLKMKAAIANQTGALAEEMALLEELLERNPEDHEARLQLAMSLARASEEDEAYEVIEVLAERLQNVRPKVLMGAARVASVLGQIDMAVRMGLRAVRIEPSEENQFSYFNICRRGNGGVFQVERVEAGVVVKLQNPRDDSDTREYIIVDESVHGRLSGEHTIDDEAVERLQGHEVGETIRWRRGRPLEQRYEIKEIESLAAYTCRKLASEFSRQFPESSLMRSFRVGEEPEVEDLAPIIGTLTEGEERRETVLSAYDEHNIPISMVAEVLGYDVPKVYAYLASRERGVLRVEYGGRDELDRAATMARLSEALVLTRTSLITLDELGLRAVLEECFDTLVVPQFLYDELNAELRMLEEHLPDGRMTIATVNGELQLIQESPEQTRTYYERQEELRDWLVGASQVHEVPVEAYEPENERYRNVLDRGSFASLAISVGEDVPLYVDDLGLREVDLQRPPGGVEGFSTAALLLSCMEEEVISEDEFAHHISELISLNHFFVPLNPDVLFHVLSDKGYRLDGEVINVFERLEGGFCEPRSGVKIGVELLRRIALSPGAPSISMVTRLLVETLAENNPLPDTLILLRNQGRKRLALLPRAIDELEDAIVSYLLARGFG